ncbi:hypothetical protein LCGC14_1352580 [marine sediment metagenome]|uniref:Uncharacterized protein n=1 Tax=marine sediment metagenome TaxID=412755 RepID=A0A0F9KB53_9ZZZZ
MAFNIIAVTTGIGGSFKISGDQRTKFPNNIEFRVFGSTGNDDPYTVQSTLLVTGLSVSGFQVVNLGDNDLNGFQEVDVGGVPGGKEVTDVTTVADIAGSLGGTHFLLDSPTTQYYVWYDVDGGSTDPAPAGRTPIEVDISTGDSADVVASATSAAIGANPDFNVGLAGPVVTVTNNAAGNVPDAVDVDAGFAIAVIIQGVGVVNTTATGLADDATEFTATIAVDGGTAQAIAVTGSLAQTYLELITEINIDLVDAVASIVDGNIRVTSDITGDESSILITDTGGDPLFVALTAFSAVSTAVPGGVTLSGFQVADVGGAIVNSNSTNLDDNGVREVTDVTTGADIAGSLNSTFFNLDTPGLDYYVWYNVSGGGVDPNPGGRVGIEVAISTGASANAVADATSAELDQETDFIATFSTNVVTVTNVAKGAAPNATDGSAPTGFGLAVTTPGSDGTVYTATIAIDGGGAQPIAVPGSNAQNYLELVNEINDDLTGATASITDGNVRITSDTTGTSSTVSIVDTGGSPLFGSLIDFVEILTAVTVTPTGLANDATVFTASVSIDGGGVQPIAVTGTTVQNYDGLLTEINTDIAGGTATIDSNRNLRITSATFDPSSTVDINTTVEVTTVADVAGSLNSTFFLLDSSSTGYYVWYDVSAGGVDPGVGGRTGIEVDISTNDIANTVAANTAAAIDLVIDLSASATLAVVTITDAIDVTDGSAPTVFTFAKSLINSLNLFQAINTAVPGEDDTVITVFSNVPDATVDGDIFLPGSYLLEFTDDNVNPPFMLEPETIDGPPGTTTSLSLIGRGTLNYGERFNENFLHLLENFASDGTEPTDPIVGQLWYDDAVNLLKIFDGSFNPLATGSTLTIQDESVAIPNSPHSTLNFIGSGVVATDSGGGVADITISVTSAGTIINDADGDTAIDVEDTVDEDIIRFDTGETPVGYGAVVDIMTLASSGLTISMGTANAVATGGAPISITAGTGNTTGDGGDISLVPGAGGASGEDGAVILNTTTFKELTTETVSAGATVIGSVAIPNNTSVLFEVLGVGRETGGQTIAKRIFGSIENTGGTTALVGSTSEDRTDSGGTAVDWDITAVADDASDELDLTVDDGGTETVEWKVSVKFLSVTQ